MYLPDYQIVIEGPDLSGKSTISILLQVITGLEVYHAGGPPKTPIEASARVYGYPKDMILDRHFCISESVYGYLRQFTIIQEGWMKDYLRQQEFILVYCRLPLDFLKDQLHYLYKSKKSHKSKDHIDWVVENYESIHMAYDRLVAVYERERICQVVTVDFRTITSTRLQEAIKRANNEYKRRRQ